VVYPPFVRYKTESEYREHYEKVYCRCRIVTFDGITVRFRKSQFQHAFFESSRRDGKKDNFSEVRAERIDWIKTALEDSESERYQGRDRESGGYSKNRRVTVVMDNYIVIFDLTSDTTGEFITAFVDRGIRTPGHPRTVDQIRSAPKWE
jgi:hypothetical protein